MEKPSCLFILLIYFLLPDPSMPQCDIECYGIRNQFMSVKSPEAG